MKGLDPEDDEEYQKVLKQYGLDDFAGSVDELKEYIIETLRTGSAQQIRENIKYLNEKGKTQHKQNLALLTLIAQKTSRTNKLNLTQNYIKFFRRQATRALRMISTPNFSLI